MIESKVARRYAKSLLILAQERQLTEKVFADMQMIDATIKSSRDLSLLLHNPIVKTDKKENILKAVFGSHIQPLTLSFMDLMTKKGRESYLEGIAVEFVSIYKASIGIKIAHVKTAVPLDAATREQVMKLISQTNTGTIELVEEVDRELIGGFVLRVGDRQYDASVGKKLRQLKNEFDDNLYVKEL